MKITVQFFSYFKDICGCSQLALETAPGSTVAMLLTELMRRYPALARMQNAMLIAVGLEYAERGQPLREGDEVSLFPPVQGG